MDIIPLFYGVFILFFPLICVFAFTPYLWKKNSAFGVMLPKELKSSKQLIGLSRSFVVFAIVAGLCFASTAMIVQNNGVTLFCAVVYVVLCLAMFIMNNRLVRNIIAVNDYENTQKPVFVKNLTTEFKIKTISFWWIALLLIPAAVSFYDAYKNHTDILYIIPVIQTLIAVAVAASFYLIIKSKQYVDKKTACDDMKRNAFVRRKLSALIFCIALLISIFLMLMQLCGSGTLTSQWITVVMPAVVTVVVTVMIIVFCIKINK